MSKRLKSVMELLETRRLHPAMRFEADIEAAANEGVVLHPLVLSPTRNNRDLTYIHPQRLINELDERGEFLNLSTLEFEKKAKAPVEPAKATTTEPLTPKETATETTDKTPAEPAKALEMETYTELELKAMLKAKLLHIAGVDPDVNTKGSKAELITKLTGRPKFPLPE